ncbi:hypothetical protein SDJN03_01428, partial [Cucurbita argyrosperma subsp. sororia]
MHRQRKRASQSPPISLRLTSFRFWRYKLYSIFTSFFVFVQISIVVLRLALRAILMAYLHHRAVGSHDLVSRCTLERNSQTTYHIRRIIICDPIWRHKNHIGIFGHTMIEASIALIGCRL